MPTQEIFKQAEGKMSSSIQALDQHFNTLRTGRASTALLDDIKVDAYGQDMPLNNVASVSTPDARTIVVQPWDVGQLPSIERAIMVSDLGINPSNDGKCIRLSIPPLTEERRKELVKKAAHMAEEARIAIRNVRRHSKDEIEKLRKDKELSDDQAHDANDDLQKLTDKWIKKVDEHLAKKEKEIMEV
ncbi:MAG: ribosome recycling factor [Candidatus Sumerlaeia bacterium]|nr:ribosome recycling factor [Candidatus Sumerlaeia bacterium]